MATLQRCPVGQYFIEIGLSHTDFEIYAFLCFAIFCEKFEHSKWPPFLARPNFRKNVLLNLQTCPVGQKNSSISLYLAQF